jgi:chromosome condensin MukBEF complex kleisin-like MukF subunit
MEARRLKSALASAATAPMNLKITSCNAGNRRKYFLIQWPVGIFVYFIKKQEFTSLLVKQVGQVVNDSLNKTSRSSERYKTSRFSACCNFSR